MVCQFLLENKKTNWVQNIFFRLFWNDERKTRSCQEIKASRKQAMSTYAGIIFHNNRWVVADNCN